MFSNPNAENMDRCAHRRFELEVCTCSCTLRQEHCISGCMWKYLPSTIIKWQFPLLYAAGQAERDLLTIIATPMHMHCVTTYACHQKGSRSIPNLCTSSPTPMSVQVYTVFRLYACKHRVYYTAVAINDSESNLSFYH